MKWTTEKPTEPGWYWFELGPIYKISIRYFNSAKLSIKSAIEKDAKWAGPIPMPEDE